MSDRQKSSRAGIAAVVLFLILALIGSFFTRYDRGIPNLLNPQLRERMLWSSHPDWPTEYVSLVGFVCNASLLVILSVIRHSSDHEIARSFETGLR